MSVQWWPKYTLLVGLTGRETGIVDHSSRFQGAARSSRQSKLLPKMSDRRSGDCSISARQRGGRGRARGRGPNEVFQLGQQDLYDRSDWLMQPCARVGPSCRSLCQRNNLPRVCKQWLAGRFGAKFEAEGCAGGARRQSRYAGGLLGTWMEDTGGKSGRRPGRHLQVEASGPGNATTVQQSLWVDSGAAKTLKVAPAQSGPKSVRRSSPRDLDGRYRR